MEKEDLHLRSRHRSSYDFVSLISACPELKKFVFINKYKNETVDFADPAAVKALNKALLKVFYNVSDWDIPAGYLCPPIPGRADYVHYMADLLMNCNKGTLPKGNKISCLDIGTGANLVYPLIGNAEYGWSFTGTDIDDTAIASAKKILSVNPQIKNIQLRKQDLPSRIFIGIIAPNDQFDLTFCNPPFHSSADEAREGSARKVKNLSGGKIKKPVLNFGGKNSELWCKGGEKLFISRMITESVDFGSQCFWFSTLVSKSENLKSIYYELDKIKASAVKTLEMKQGNKISRAVAWTFLDPSEQKKWQQDRFEF